MCVREKSYLVLECTCLTCNVYIYMYHLIHPLRVCLLINLICLSAKKTHPWGVDFRILQAGTPICWGPDPQVQIHLGKLSSHATTAAFELPMQPLALKDRTPQLCKCKRLLCPNGIVLLSLEILLANSYSSSCVSAVALKNPFKSCGTS